MKLTSNNETLAENKVLILYILNNVKEALTNNNLYKIVLAVIDMNYFYFQQFLLDLIDNDYIMHYQNEDITLYQITDKGKQTLELTEDILPGIIKLQVDMNLKGAMEEVSDESSIIAEYTPKSENYYNITCKIVEKNETIFELKTIKDSVELALNHPYKEIQKLSQIIYGLCKLITDIIVSDSGPSPTNKSVIKLLFETIEAIHYNYLIHR